MSNKCCPNCGRELTEYEISSLWCSACNSKFENPIGQEEYTGNVENNVNEKNVGVESSVSDNIGGMRSASTLRVCSTIITVLMIIGAVILFFLYFDEEEVLFLILPIPMIFAAIIQNAFLKGVADIIDNTYEMKLLMRKNLK